MGDLQTGDDQANTPSCLPSLFHGVPAKTMIVVQSEHLGKKPTTEVVLNAVGYLEKPCTMHFFCIIDSGMQTKLRRVAPSMHRAWVLSGECRCFSHWKSWFHTYYIKVHTQKYYMKMMGL